MPRSPIHDLRRQLVRLAREFAKFGTVGAAGMVIDLGLFNLLVFGGGRVLAEHPLPARTLSIAAATVVTYLGNRFWTWRHTERRGMHREYALFFVLNGIGLGINLSVLWLATEALGATGPIWTNLANLTGIGLGTLFRFWSYRRFVFRAPSLVGPAEPSTTEATSIDATTESTFGRAAELVSPGPRRAPGTESIGVPEGRPTRTRPDRPDGSEG